MLGKDKKNFTQLLTLAFVLLVAIAFVGTARVEAAETQSAATGKPLPPDGGDLGKAYMEYCRAIKAGDMAALKKVVSADRAKEMDDPEFAKMFFPMIQSIMAKDIKITGGTIAGNQATLNAQGKDEMTGGVSKGTISMVLEGTQWKVAEDSWK